MSTQYAGTPTGTGKALPQYLSDADIQGRPRARPVRRGQLRRLAES